MNTEYGPVGTDIISEDLRNWRADFYAEQGVQPGHESLIPILSSYMDDFMDTFQRDRNYTSDGERSANSASELFWNQSDEGNIVLTGIKIVIREYKGRGVLRKEQILCYRIADQTGRGGYASVYKISKYIGNFYQLQLIEQASEAHPQPEDEAAATGYANGTDYDTEWLFSEIKRLHNTNRVQVASQGED